MHFCLKFLHSVGEDVRPEEDDALIFVSFEKDADFAVGQAGHRRVGGSPGIKKMIEGPGAALVTADVESEIRAGRGMSGVQEEEGSSGY